MDHGKSGSLAAISFRLDSTSGVPPYLQIVQQVERALSLGHLQRGDQLPRVKDVVGSLAINPNTVLKAYRLLEQKGLTSGRPGQGTFVEAQAARVTLSELHSLEQRLTSSWLPDAAAAGLDEDGIVALFMSALRLYRSHAEKRRPPRAGGRARKSGGAA